MKIFIDVITKKFVTLNHSKFVKHINDLINDDCIVLFINFHVQIMKNEIRVNHFESSFDFFLWIIQNCGIIPCEQKIVMTKFWETKTIVL